MKELTKLESKALTMLVAGDHPALSELRSQLSSLVVDERGFDSYGLFITFKLPPGYSAVNNYSYVLKDVEAEIPGFKYPVFFPLSVEHGKLYKLESHSGIKQDTSDFKLSYTHEGSDGSTKLASQRDMAPIFKMLAEKQTHRLTNTRSLTNLEKDAIKMLLAGDHPVLANLREQINYLVVSAEHDANGYITLKLTQDCPVISRDSYPFQDVLAKVPGLDKLQEIYLHIENGKLHKLKAPLHNANDDCRSGALGAAVGEATALVWKASTNPEQLATKLGQAVASGELSFDEAEALVYKWQQQGVNLAKLAADRSSKKNAGFKALFL